METVDSNKRSVDFYQTTLSYISDDNTLHSHGSESLKYMKKFNYILFTVEEYFYWILIFQKLWRRQALHCPTPYELLCNVSKVCHSYTKEIMHHTYIVDNIRLTILSALTQINLTLEIFRSNGWVYTQFYLLLYRIAHKSHTTNLKFITVEYILICLWFIWTS
jgi:hypothetical protein